MVLRLRKSLVGGQAEPARNASAGLVGTPLPSRYMKPRLACASAIPWSAAKRNQRTASAESPYPKASLIHQAKVGLRHRQSLLGGQAQPAHSLGGVVGTPLPSRYIEPRLVCAVASPCSAAKRNQRTASAGSCLTPSRLHTLRQVCSARPQAPGRRRGGTSAQPLRGPSEGLSLPGTSSQVRIEQVRIPGPPLCDTTPTLLGSSAPFANSCHIDTGDEHYLH